VQQIQGCLQPRNCSGELMERDSGRIGGRHVKGLCPWGINRGREENELKIGFWVVRFLVGLIQRSATKC